MAASRTQEKPSALSTPAAPPVDEKDDNPHRRQATAEVKAYRTIPGVGAQKQKGELTIYTNPLSWWKDNSTKFPLLSALSHPVLAIPATQAQSERTISSAGQILTKTRNRLDPNKLDLMSLKYSWGLIDEWMT